jgi:hypothetical protein
MLISKKSLIVAICLFVIAFKVAAGSIFVQSAIERAYLQSHACMAAVEAKTIPNDTSDNQQPVHTLYLMYHVIANISDTEILIPTQKDTAIAYLTQGDKLYFDNIPDSAFKPPKYIL